MTSNYAPSYPAQNTYPLWTRAYEQSLPNRNVTQVALMAPMAPMTPMPPMAPMVPMPADINKNTNNQSRIARQMDVPSTKALIYNIASVGISTAMFVTSIVIGLIALITSLQGTIPPGTIVAFSGSAINLISKDDQWLYCDGSAVSRVIYRDLYDVIGTRYGSGNDIDTFNLPDLRDRFIRGSNLSTNSQLQTGGSVTVTLTIPNLPAHDHTQGTLTTASDGFHSHAVSDPGHNHGGSTGTARHGTGSGSFAVFGSSSEFGTHSHSIPTGTTGVSLFSSGAHTHTVVGSTGSVGSAQPIDILPPYTTMHYVIKT